MLYYYDPADDDELSTQFVLVNDAKGNPIPATDLAGPAHTACT